MSEQLLRGFREIDAATARILDLLSPEREAERRREFAETMKHDEAARAELRRALGIREN